MPGPLGRELSYNDYQAGKHGSGRGDRGDRNLIIPLYRPFPCPTAPVECAPAQNAPPGLPDEVTDPAEGVTGPVDDVKETVDDVVDDVEETVDDVVDEVSDAVDEVTG